MTDEEIKVKVITETDTTKVDALEKKLKELKELKLKQKLEIDSENLDKVNKRIKELTTFLDEVKSGAEIPINVDSSEIEKAERELESLKEQQLKLQISVADGELKQAKAEEDALNDTAQVKIDADTGDLKEAKQDVKSLKSELAGLAMGAIGFSEVKDGIKSMIDAAGSADQNKAFLTIGYKGDEKSALEAQKKIQDVVAKAPGDDIAMNSIISSAVAKDVSLADKDLQGFGNSVADYFAGAEVNGKHAAEAIQDIRSYINSGNVAELETTGVFDATQLEELKNIDSVGERVAKFQEMINQSSYAGLGTADTLTNKFAELDGMIAKGQTDLGQLFTPAIGGALDYINYLNEITNGGFGMLLAAAQPVGGALMGIAGTMSDISNIDKNWNIRENFGTVKEKATQLATNLKGTLTGAWNGLKNTMSGVRATATTLGAKLLEAGRSAVIAGANALRSTAGWIAQKIQLVASTAATWLQTAAQWALNIAMSMNPIMLVVIAIAALIAILVYLYYNVDWVREGINNLGQGALAAWNMIKNAFLGIVSSIAGALSSAWNRITNFISNLISSFVNGAQNAVNGFMNWIRQLPGMLAGELQKMLEMASNFIMEIANKLTGGAAGMVVGWITGSGEHSPGYMYDAFTGELKEMEKAPSQYDIAGNMQSVGEDMVRGFDPTLNTSSGGTTKTSNNKITINIENVDNDDRVQQIAKAVEQVLKFDNATAGRDV